MSRKYIGGSFGGSGGLPAAGSYTNLTVGTLTVTGQGIFTVATGTAPLVITSTTNIPNLNASLLLGNTWAIPGTIGSTTPNTGAFTTLAASGTLTLTGAAPQISLANGTSNWVQWAAAGVGAPAFTTRSAGTKLVLYPEVAAAKVDEALGVEAGFMWFSVADSGTGYKWYAATTAIASLSGTGTFTAVAYVAGSSAGIDTTITTGSLVGKTITVTKGLITGFA